MAEIPLADHMRGVAGGLQDLRENLGGREGTSVHQQDGGGRVQERW